MSEENNNSSQEPAKTSNEDALRQEIADLRNIIESLSKKEEKPKEDDFFDQETKAQEYNKKMENIEAQSREVAQLEIRLSNLIAKETLDNAKKNLAEIKTNKDKLNFLYKLAFVSKHGKEKLNEFDSLGEEGKKLRAIDSLESLEKQRNNIPFTEIGNQILTKKDVTDSILDKIKNYHIEKTSMFTQF